MSLGEHADVDFGDLLDHLASDPATRAILLYIESVTAPRKFMSAARAAARNKPVIVVKAGRGGRGAQAAASHTGALAGSDIVYDAAIRRAGMLRVDTLQELFIAAQTLARFRGNRSECLTIMTNGGGGGVMAADAAERAGIPLFEPPPALLARLDAVLPATWSHANPVDVIGDAPVARYTATLEALLAEPASGAILFMHAPTAIVPSSEIAAACAPLAAAAKDRVLACWLGDAAVAQARKTFEQAGIADYATPEEAVRAFELLRTYRRNQEQLLEAPAASHPGTPDLEAARAVIRSALARGATLLTEPEAKAVLAACGVNVARTITSAADPQAAAAAAQTIGYPVVLKILSRDLSHKSDVGGVRLNLADAQAVREAAAQMLERIARERPQARLDGFAVQQMVIRPQAHELIVGASIDAVFGPVLLFGQGGTAVEVIADRAVALPPLNRALAAEMVSRTRVARLIAGYRDRPPIDHEALFDTLIAVSQMLVDLPELAELDINPLLADAQGVIALDARIRISATPGAGAQRFAIRPYPAHLVEHLQWQGRAIVLRPIRPEDEAQHREFIEVMEADDLRMRFFHTVRELPRTELARLTQIDYEREMAFIAEGLDERGRPQTLGTARAVSDPDNIEAEFAVIVRSDLKGLGLGRLLMDKLVRYATTHGTERLVGTVLRENKAMQQLAFAIGFTADMRKQREPDLISIVLPLRPIPGATTD